MACPWFVLVAGLAGAQEPLSPLETGLVRSVELESLPGTWVQHFRLDREGARAGEPALGLLRYVAGPDREGGVHVDLELEYLADGVRVIHTEQASHARRRLVFREVGEGTGRTLFLEGGPESGFEGYELGGPDVIRHDLAQGGEFPLLLVESARLGFALPTEVPVLDPLAACFEPLELSLRSGTPEGMRAAADRVLEARRADGSLRWRICVKGEQLIEWRFHECGPVARAISPTEFEGVRNQHELGARAAREAAASSDRRRSPPAD